MFKKKHILITLILIIFVVIITDNIYHQYYGLVRLAYSNSKGELSFIPTLKTKRIYLFEFGEGEDFYIFNYNSDEIKKVIKKNNFKKIGKNNENEVKQLLTKYREDLCEKELKLFNKTTSISELSHIGNYYLYLELNEKDYFICIIDTADNKLNVLFVNH